LNARRRDSDGGPRNGVTAAHPYSNDHT